MENTYDMLNKKFKKSNYKIAFTTSIFTVFSILRCWFNNNYM